MYVDLLPPCNAGCPAGENIQAWLAEARAGRHEQAWTALVADNPIFAARDDVDDRQHEPAGQCDATGDVAVRCDERTIQENS